MSQTEIQALEKELYEKYKKLVQLRRDNEAVEIKDYKFKTTEGETSLSQLFGDKDTLFLIHNMGQGCRYCTLWADGFNAFLPHLESSYAVALVSKDDPQLQRRFANERGWRFRTASHGGGEYIKEQSVATDEESPAAKNYPGMVCYTKKDGRLFRKNSAVFGPGDEYCSMWNILSLAGHDAETWTPQFNYWKRPEQMDDGGKNLN